MSEDVDKYRIKRIKYFGKNVGIICQNANGPCPLIALCNVLLLKGSISIHADHAIVTFSHLSNLLVEYLVDANIVGHKNANVEYNVNDVIGFMPSLQYGLDVNVKFSSIVDFEFTQNHLVFDLLNVRLVHGWLLDPQDTTTANVVGTLSYNLLVERIIRMREIEEHRVQPTLDEKQEQQEQESGEDLNVFAAEGHIIEAFLSHSAGQLTYHGLLRLHEDVREGELCVLFRNNHFSTMLRHGGELFLLVTDVGYIAERVVWEKLCEIDGNNVFVDSEFMVPQARLSMPGASSVVDAEQQERADRLMALQIAQQQEETPVPPTATVEPGFHISEAQMRQQQQIFEQIQRSRASPTQSPSPPGPADRLPSRPDHKKQSSPPMQQRLGYPKGQAPQTDKKAKDKKCSVM